MIYVCSLFQYINGGSLEDILQDRTFPLPWTMRASIASDISKGMAYLHSKKIFHRDLTSKVTASSICVIMHIVNFCDGRKSVYAHMYVYSVCVYT